MSLLKISSLQEIECRKARAVELEKLKERKAYRIEKDEGQSRISSTWELWMKQTPEGSKWIRARLVARRHEEKYEVPNVNTTIAQMNINVLLALCATNKWMNKTSKVKSASMQGRQWDRIVTIKQSRETRWSKDSSGWDNKIHCVETHSIYKIFCPRDRDSQNFKTILNGLDSPAVSIILFRWSFSFQMHSYFCISC